MEAYLTHWSLELIPASTARQKIGTTYAVLQLGPAPLPLTNLLQQYLSIIVCVVLRRSLIEDILMDLRIQVNGCVFCVYFHSFNQIAYPSVSCSTNAFSSTPMAHYPKASHKSPMQSTEYIHRYGPKSVLM